MRKTFAATIWTSFEKLWTQLVGFIIGIILARLLTPSDYGLVGISTMFIAFSNVFIEAGFSNALIRKLDRNQADYSTAFYFNAIMGLLIYLIISVSAPAIATFFNDEKLISLIRIVGTTVILNSLCIVPNAILTSEFKMKDQAIINISAQIPSGLVAIYLAYNGFGIYSLAVQVVLSSLVRTIMFWCRSQWRPDWVFSRSSMSYLWHFGSKLIGANFIGTLFNEIYTILIGKFYNATDLGIYSKSRNLSTQADVICNGVVQKVAVPLLAGYQKDQLMLREKYKELTQIINCIMLLVSGMLIAVSEPLILLMWGQKWADTIPVFKLLLVSNIVAYISYLSLILLQVINRTEYMLKLEFIKKPVCLLSIIILARYGLFGLLSSLIFNAFFCSVVNMSSAAKFINYSYLEQFQDVFKYVISIVVSLLLVKGACALYETGLVLDIFIRIIIVFTVYTGLLYLLKDNIFIRFCNFTTLKNFFSRGKQ